MAVAVTSFFILFIISLFLFDFGCGFGCGFGFGFGFGIGFLFATFLAIAGFKDRAFFVRHQIFCELFSKIS